MVGLSDWCNGSTSDFDSDSSCSNQLSGVKFYSFLFVSPPLFDKPLRWYRLNRV